MYISPEMHVTRIPAVLIKRISFEFSIVQFLMCCQVLRCLELSGRIQEYLGQQLHYPYYSYVLYLDALYLFILCRKNFSWNLF